MPADPRQRAHLMRLCWALAKDLTLTDDERRELAMMLPTRGDASEPVSWATLDASELAHLANWLSGARLVRDLLRMRVG